MNEDKKYSIEDLNDFATHFYNQGIFNGGEHSQPSPQTLNLIDGLEKKIDSNHKEVMDIISPIADTYKTASELKGWIMGFLIFISVAVGILIGIKDLFFKKNGL